MLSLRFANYINDNMESRGWKNQHLEKESTVPDSSISSYRKGLTKKPSRDNMILIAAAFGDPPSVIDQMIAESNGTTSEEAQRLMAEAADQERLERIVAMMREQMVQMLSEFREQSAAQQTEIIQHADERVAAAEAEANKRITEAEVDFKRRNAAVLEQCREEVQREKDHCQQRIDDMRQYASHVFKVEREHRKDLRIRNQHSREYLKSMVRNISACAILCAAIAFVSSVYGVFAFFAFDLSDPTRGLYQGNVIFAVLILSAILGSVAFIFWRLILLYRRRIRSESKIEDEEGKNLEDIEA